MQANTTPHSTRSENTIYWFLLFWTLLNLLQACTMGLHSDEAYYWLYSRFLDWGYFDHPPMVALFIHAGDSIVHNELGVRFVNIMASTTSLYLLWRIVKPYQASALAFILVTGGIFTLHIFGFVTTPDGPLLLFTALFFYIFKQYLEQNKWWQALLLGVIVACLLYSKYHAVLLIGFVVLANIKLLGRWSFWLIVVLAACIFLPHILWQINHDYPSLKYHLSDRVQKLYKFRYTYEYVLLQLLMAGPLISWFLFYKGFTARVNGDAFLRTLKFVLIGVIFFFLFSTRRGEVQGQWTAIALMAMSLLVVIGFSQSGSLPIWFKKLAVINIIVIVAVRLILIAHLPFVKNIEAVKNMYVYKDWAHMVKQKAGNNWVIMDDGFQVPSLYCFYNNTYKCFSYDSRFYRLTQFEIWPMEEQIQGKRAYFIWRNSYPGLIKNSIQTAAGVWHDTWIDDVRTYQRVEVTADGVDEIKTSPGKKNLFNLSIKNPYSYAIDFTNNNQQHTVSLDACFYEITNEMNVQQAPASFNNIKLQAGASAKYAFEVTAPEKKGEYTLAFSIHTQPFSGSKNSRSIKFTVE